MQEKAERNAEHLPAPPMTSPRPLPRRGGQTCKEISYNSLRNYALYIVNYELTTIQHSAFNIKNYASCIVHYALNTIQHSTFNIKNYVSCIVNYELTTIQHSTFNIKNYVSCIVNYELTTIQHSTFNIKNYASCIVHYALNKFDITDCAVAFQATESFCLHCNLMKIAPNLKANYTVT